MAVGIACLPFLLCIWEPVQAALTTFLGAAVADLLSYLRVRVVAAVGNLTVLWGNQVEQVPLSSASLAGAKEIRGYLNEIAGYLKDDTVGVVGIWGMGGIGKTTLLQIINNHLHDIIAGAPWFDVVIWVTVSKDPNIHEIQKQIGDRLGLSLCAEGDAGSSSQAKKQADDIFRALHGRRYLLLLDDVWEKLDLTQVRIPLPSAQNKCKIILTTRKKEVWQKMGANRRLLEVKGLNESEAWRLFEENVGTEVDLDRPAINPHAKVVVGKCGGLPLALVVVGRAMANAVSDGEWRVAAETLREVVEEEVLHTLKFSYDRLSDETTKQCLLYCCLFPEDHMIPVEELVEFWAGEGFFDTAESDSITRARDRGHGVISQLTAACLLERGTPAQDYVKMHDVVREMCLWLTGGKFDSSNTFLVHAGWGFNLLPRSELWGNAKRISLLYNQSRFLLGNVPQCPNLRTFLCRRGSIHEFIPQGFFRLMPALRVLDLSHTKLESLPDEIGLLSELRCLNLARSWIMALPTGLGRLAKLRQLNLDYTPCLAHIPREAITSLTTLQTLGLCGSVYAYYRSYEQAGFWSSTTMLRPPSPSSSSSTLFIDDMECCLPQLQEVRLSVTDPPSLKTLLSLGRLPRCTTDLFMMGTNTAAYLFQVLSKCEKLSQLVLLGLSWDENVRSDCGSLSETLRRLEINNSHEIHDLTWIRQLPCLEEITLEDCTRIEELVSTVDGSEGENRDEQARDCDCSCLRQLRRMGLQNLPALKSISRRPMLLPSLELLRVRKCRQLKKLPFGPNSASNLRVIKGEKDWWDDLEWYDDVDGQSIKRRFQCAYEMLR